MIKKNKHNIAKEYDALYLSPTSKNTGSLSFYYKVYEIVLRIPRGKVTTYGAIAQILGMKSSSRLVGQALRSIPEGFEIPAQRVINRAGLLTGAHQFGGYERMRRILEKEGVAFKGDSVDMEKYFWEPSFADLG